MIIAVADDAHRRYRRYEMMQQAGVGSKAIRMTRGWTFLDWSLRAASQALWVARSYEPQVPRGGIAGVLVNPRSSPMALLLRWTHPS